MKKALITILKIIGGLLAFLILLVFLLVQWDKIQTRYLNFDQLPSAQANSYLLINANIIPMNRDTVLKNKMLEIREGKIFKIADQIDAEDLIRIDLKGQFLIPGLNDMHVHLWDRQELGLYLANGVTGIRNVWGMPMHLDLKEDITKGKIISPSFYTTGPKLTGRKFIGDDNLQLSSPKEARAKVREYQKRGYDYIKTYYGLDADLFEAIIEECQKLKMDIVAHPSDKVDYSYHFQEPIISLEHVEDVVQRALDYKLDSAKLDSVILDFKNYPSSALCPTVMAYYNIYRMIEEADILENDSLAFMNAMIRMTDSKAQFNRWQNTLQENAQIGDQILAQHQFQLYTLKKLKEAEVNIICGTDAGIGITLPGFSLHQELAFYQQAGFSNFEALETATINVAKTHGEMKDLGSVEVGKRANLLVVKNNPLKDLATLGDPQMLWVEGHLLGKSELTEFKLQAKNRSNLIATAYRYLVNILVEK